MKKEYIIRLLVLFCTYGLVTAQTSEEYDLESFSNANISGNVELHLISSNQPSVKIEAKNKAIPKQYTMGVKNKEFFLHHNNDTTDDNTSKIVVYLHHNGIQTLRLKGIINVISENDLDQTELTIEGEGMIKGDITVSVKNLNVSLSGIIKMTVSGNAENATLNIEGIGKINTKRLVTEKLKKNGQGLVAIGAKHETKDDKVVVTFKCDSCKKRNKFKISGPENHMFKEVAFPFKRYLPTGSYQMTYWQNGVQQIHLPFTVTSKTSNQVTVK